MKRFYAYNTTDENNEKEDGMEFITDSIPDDEFEAIDKEFEKRQKKSDARKRFKLMVMCASVLILTALTGIGSLFDKDSRVLWDIMQEPLYLVFIAACTVVFVWGIIDVIKRKNAQRDGTYVEVDEFEKVDDLYWKRLNVPANAPKIDVMAFDYDDTTGPDKRYTECMNVEMRAFVENDALCLVDLENRFEFPLSSLKRITRESCPVEMLFWNKEVSYKKDPYDRFGIKQVKGNYVVPEYYNLELEREGELWAIAVPSYDLHVIRYLTGLCEE